MQTTNIRIGDLICKKEAEKMIKFVYGRSGTSPHNAIMQWLDSQPEIIERFRKHGVLQSYGAYLFEYTFGIV